MKRLAIIAAGWTMCGGIAAATALVYARQLMCGRSGAWERTVAVLDRFFETEDEMLRP